MNGAKLLQAGYRQAGAGIGGVECIEQMQRKGDHLHPLDLGYQPVERDIVGEDGRYRIVVSDDAVEVARMIAQVLENLPVLGPGAARKFVVESAECQRLIQK